MGQAKNRGTREQRIAQSIENTRLKEEADKQAAKDWWESLTDEEQQAERKKRRQGKQAMRNFHLMTALAHGMNAGHH